MKVNHLLYLSLFLLSLSITTNAQDRRISISNCIENYQLTKAIAIIDSALMEVRSLYSDTLPTRKGLMQERDLVLLKSGCLKKLYIFDAAISELSLWNGKYLALTNTIDDKVMSELAECHSLKGNLEEAVSAYFFSNNHQSRQFLLCSSKNAS